METKQDNQSINFSLIIKILYKNFLLILSTIIIITFLAAFFAFTSKSYKSDIILYGNDKILNEIGENAQYSLNSFDFMKYIKENSKTLTNLSLPDEKFVKEMSKRLTAQTETGNPTIKVKFTSKNKDEAEGFSKEYITLAQGYLEYREHLFLDNQIQLLEKQYNFINQNIDIRTTKDSLTDTLVSRLAYYRLIKTDTTPTVRLVSEISKPALNKKLVLAGGFIFGILLGIFIALLKSFSKTLNWQEIKE